MTASREQGLAGWHPHWDTAHTLYRTHLLAHRTWRDAMVRVHAAGEASLWHDLLTWTRHTPVGPDQVDALLAAAGH